MPATPEDVEIEKIRAADHEKTRAWIMQLVLVILPLVPLGANLYLSWRTGDKLDTAAVAREGIEKKLDDQASKVDTVVSDVKTAAERAAEATEHAKEVNAGVKEVQERVKTLTETMKPTEPPTP